MNELRGGASGALVLSGSKLLADEPWPAFSIHRPPAGFKCRERQRAVGRRVQVADIAWDIEERALRRQHSVRPSGLIRPANRTIRRSQQTRSAVALPPFA